VARVPDKFCAVLSADLDRAYCKFRRPALDAPIEKCTIHAKDLAHFIEHAEAHDERVRVHGALHAMRHEPEH